jgi:hypothetical protein
MDHLIPQTKYTIKESVNLTFILTSDIPYYNTPRMNAININLNTDQVFLTEDSDLGWDWKFDFLIRCSDRLMESTNA